MEGDDDDDDGTFTNISLADDSGKFYSCLVLKADLRPVWFVSLGTDALKELYTLCQQRMETSMQVHVHIKLK